jgi:phage terminase small subunit
MGILKNQRHEKFASELAKDKNPTQAYADAGYQLCRQNAHRLSSNDDIKRRVIELREQRQIENKNNRDGETGQFLQGKSGNPVGRPKGSRNKLGEQFLNDLRGEWQRSGVSALERVAKDDPTAFVKVVANVLPREVDATLNLDLTAAHDFITAFRLARRHVADPDDPLLLDLTAEPHHETD